MPRYFEEENEANIMLYLLTTCVGLGVWVVVRRYHDFKTRAVKFDMPAPEAASPNWTGQILPQPSLEAHLLNPLLVPNTARTATASPDAKFITCYDPSTGAHIATLPADDAYSIGQKIGQAGAAQHHWKTTTFDERRKVLKSIQRWLLDNKDLCARVAARDTGKTMVDAALGEILVTLSKLEWLINYGEDALKPQKRRGNFVLMHKTSTVYYEPLGVVAGIVSWNYPLHNALSPIIASIFAGNGVVLKCSEHVAWSTSWYVGAVRGILETCGHDPDIVQLVTCWPEEAPILTTSPWIRHITFIGSEVVGRKVAEAACRNLTPVTLELGGKDPAVILPGTNLERYASVWMRGVFQGAGQNCIGIERLLVHSSQHDELMDILADRAGKLRLGSILAPALGEETSAARRMIDDPSVRARGFRADDDEEEEEELAHSRRSSLAVSDRTNSQPGAWLGGFRPIVDCGSMISTDRFSELEQIIRDSADDGAILATGGTRWTHAYLERGAYFAPTVLGNVLQGMEIAQQELFAPVALIMPYDSVDEAVDIANGTRYGLGASVFGPDPELCLNVARRLECGMVAVNDFGVTYVNQDLPFGGTKASGYGRFGGPEGLRSLTNVKAVVVDTWPRIMQTAIPGVLDYPIRSLVQSWEFLNGLLSFIWGMSWKERLLGLVRLALAGR